MTGPRKIFADIAGRGRWEHWFAAGFVLLLILFGLVLLLEPGSVGRGGR